MISSLSFAEKYRVNRTLPGTSGIFNKPYLIEDGTCIEFSNLPCCKRLIKIYEKNLGSENRYEYEYPECRHDGYYMSKQCTNFHSTPTDCKCVDEIGKELMKLDSFNEACHEEDCQKPCPRIRRFIGRICASDGSTYWNKCTFEIAKCKAKLSGVTLTVKNNGPCNSKHPGETESEHEEIDWDKEEARKMAIKGEIDWDKEEARKMARKGKIDWDKEEARKMAREGKIDWDKEEARKMARKGKIDRDKEEARKMARKGKIDWDKEEAR